MLAVVLAFSIYYVACMVLLLVSTPSPSGSEPFVKAFLSSVVIYLIVADNDTCSCALVSFCERTAIATVPLLSIRHWDSAPCVRFLATSVFICCAVTYRVCTSTLPTHNTIVSAEVKLAY